MTTSTKSIFIAMYFLCVMRDTGKTITDISSVKKIADIVLPHYESEDMLSQADFQQAMFEEIANDCGTYPVCCQAELLELIEQLRF